MPDKEIEEYNSSYLLPGPAMLCPTTCERYVLRLDDLSFNGCHFWDQGFWWDENNFVVFAHWPRVVILFSICRHLLQILETISWVRNSGPFFVNKTCDSVPLSNSKQRNSLLCWTSNAAWSWSSLFNMRTTKSVVETTLWNLFWSLYEPLPFTFAVQMSCWSTLCTAAAHVTLCGKMWLPVCFSSLVWWGCVGSKTTRSSTSL